MLSSNKGITLIMLVVTIVVLSILTGVAVNVGYTSYKDMQITAYVAKMNMVQARVNVINQKILEGDTSYNNIGTELSSLTDSQQEKINEILGETSTDGFKYYDETALKELGVEKIDEAVIINLNTKMIYSVLGIKYKGTIYYNQYNLPNGTQIVAYNELETQAPEFTLEKDNYGLTAQVNITNIVYDEQINGSDIYYGEVTDMSTEPVTVNFWQKVNGTSFQVTKTATYAVKLIDRNGGQTIETVDVVTCNSPELTSGMVPVIYENGNWKKLSNDQIGKWYDYAEGKWANIMLSDGLVADSEGKITTMGSMFVWIPRYSYQITSNYHNGGTGISGNINIKFLKDLTYVTTDETTTKMVNATGQNNWNVHPAFTDGSENDYANGGWDRELTGFWVAKFEASSSNPNADYGGGDVTNLDIKVLPNVTSWRKISLSNIFKNCLNMNANGNIYGIPTNAITHQMKNSEWGAVAYLAHSKYGRNGTEVTINNSTTYITGNAANSISGEGNSGITNAYNTEKGVLASTTGTIYGIYDMSGGADEIIAGGLLDAIEQYAIISGYNEKLVDKYYGTTYDSGPIKYEANSSRYGDAIYEVSVGNNPGDSANDANNHFSWNGDSMTILASMMKRGNEATRAEYAGTFSMMTESPTGLR